MASGLRSGDFIVYRKAKHSTRPGPRAREIRASACGDDYAYHVDKFWVIVAVARDGQLVVRTRRGKEHLLRRDDPAVRKARWWERLVHLQRFPKPS